MSKQEFGGATRRARREVERAARMRSAGLQRFAAGSAIWVLAVVSTATLATWAIRSAGSQLGAANNLSLPEVSTSLAPAQGLVPELSAGGYADLPSALSSAEATPSDSTGSASTRTPGRSVAVAPTSPVPAAATAASAGGGGSVVPQATTTTAAPTSHTHPPAASSTTSSPTPTATSTTTAIVAPSPTVSPVAGNQETDGGTVTATCTGTALNATSAPQDGWIVVAPVVEGDSVRTGFHKDPRTITVLIACIKGAPEFSVSE